MKYRPTDPISPILRDLHACQTARDFSRGKTIAEAWTTCDRGDWLLWFAARIGVDRKIVVGAACDCADIAPKFVARPRPAIETARKWIRGEATWQEVLHAAAVSLGAYADVAAYAAASAALYDDDDTAADYAAHAADAAAEAAAQTYDDIADGLRQCAGIVRKVISIDEIGTSIADHLRLRDGPRRGNEKK